MNGLGREGEEYRIVQEPCTVSTEALYSLYRGLVQIVQKPCTDSTEPLY